MDRRFAFEPEEKIRLPEAAGLGKHRMPDAAVDIFRFNDALQNFALRGELAAADRVHKAKERVAADDHEARGRAPVEKVFEYRAEERGNALAHFLAELAVRGVRRTRIDASAA